MLLPQRSMARKIGKQVFSYSRMACNTEDAANKNTLIGSVAGMSLRFACREKLQRGQIKTVPIAPFKSVKCTDVQGLCSGRCIPLHPKP